MSEPFVLSGYIDQWPASKWTMEKLNEIIDAKESLKIRFGPMKHIKGKILFENESRRASIPSLSKFVEWHTLGTPIKDGGGIEVKSNSNWGYFDYKYVFEVMREENLKDLDWNVFGVDVEPVDSTIWIGTPGAYTPCHFDSYGFNLHAQIRGCKRWILIEPDTDMKPTRIPYEESTVFSRVDVVGGDGYLERVKMRIVTVKAGEVIFIPPGWWHSVQCVLPEGVESNSIDSFSVSVNTWIPVPAVDNASRIHEAVAASLIAMLSECHLLNGNDLCPSEPIICLDDAMETMDEAVAQCYENKQKDEPARKRQKRDSRNAKETEFGEMTNFLKRYEESAKPVEVMSYKDLLKEIHSGPLEVCDKFEEEKEASSVGDQSNVERRRFLDAVCSPTVIKAIADNMLSW